MQAQEGDTEMNPEHIIIEIALALACGLAAGPAAVYVFNLIPFSWLCDYGENPVERGRTVAKAKKLTSEEADNITRSLVDPEFKRIKENPWRWLYGAGFCCLCVKLIMEGGLQILSVQFVIAALICCWGLLLIALADLKYMIIPDQLLLVGALAGAGFLPANLATVKAGRLGLFDAGEALGLSDGARGAVHVLLGIAIGIGLMLLVAGLGRLILGPAGAADGGAVLGGGDVKLYAVIGFCLGGSGIIFVFLLSSLTAGIDGALALARGQGGRKSSRPLGPHICAAAAIYIFAVWPPLFM